MAKWQTHGIQNPAVATLCRFESDLRHQSSLLKQLRLASPLFSEDGQASQFKSVMYSILSYGSIHPLTLPCPAEPCAKPGSVGAKRTNVSKGARALTMPVYNGSQIDGQSAIIVIICLELC